MCVGLDVPPWTPEGLFQGDMTKSMADSPPPWALRPWGDFSTVGNTAAGHPQSLEVRGVLLVKKLKLFRENWIYRVLLGFSFHRSSPHQPMLPQMGGSEEGQCATGEKTGCSLNNTTSWLVLTATLEKAVKNSLWRINLGLPGRTVG